MMADGSLDTTRMELANELLVAEAKAWDALSRYKFQMFGYWGAIWVHLNRIGKFDHANPWRTLVLLAKRGGALTSEEVREFALGHDHVAIPIRAGVTITWTDEETGEVLGRASIKGRNVVSFPRG